MGDEASLALEVALTTPLLPLLVDEAVASTDGEADTVEEPVAATLALPVPLGEGGATVLVPVLATLALALGGRVPVALSLDEDVASGLTLEVALLLGVTLPLPVLEGVPDGVTV